MPEERASPENLVVQLTHELQEMRDEQREREEKILETLETTRAEAPQQQHVEALGQQVETQQKEASQLHSTIGAGFTRLGGFVSTAAMKLTTIGAVVGMPQFAILPQLVSLVFSTVQGIFGTVRRFAGTVLGLFGSLKGLVITVWNSVIKKMALHFAALIKWLTIRVALPLMKLVALQVSRIAALISKWVIFPILGLMKFVMVTLWGAVTGLASAVFGFIAAVGWWLIPIGLLLVLLVFFFWDTLVGWIQSIWKIFREIDWGGLWDRVQNIWGGVRKFPARLQALGDWIGEQIWRVIEAIGSALTWTWENLVQPLMTWVWEKVFLPLWNLVSPILEWIWENVFQPIWGWFERFWERIREHVVDPVIGWIEPVWKTVIEWIQPKLEWFFLQYMRITRALFRALDRIPWVDMSQQLRDMNREIGTLEQQQLTREQIKYDPLEIEEPVEVEPAPDFPIHPHPEDTVGAIEDMRQEIREGFRERERERTEPPTYRSQDTIERQRQDEKQTLMRSIACGELE